LKNSAKIRQKILPGIRVSIIPKKDPEYYGETPYFGKLPHSPFHLGKSEFGIMHDYMMKKR